VLCVMFVLGDSWKWKFMQITERKLYYFGFCSIWFCYTKLLRMNGFLVQHINCVGLAWFGKAYIVIKSNYKSLFTNSFSSYCLLFHWERNVSELMFIGCVAILVLEKKWWLGDSIHISILFAIKIIEISCHILKCQH
jgi:hypothetical protein